MEQELKPGFAGEIQPPSFVTQEQEAIERRKLAAELEAQPRGTLLDLAVDNEWITSAASRFVTRQEDFDIDPNFAVTQEMLSEFDVELTADDREYISKSKSQSEFNARLGWVREDIERHKALAAYGIQGTLASLAAGVLDPVGWGVGILTAPVSLGAKTTSIGRTIRAGLTVGAESAAFEAALAAGDTQRGLDDILFATGAGALLGSSLSALFRGRKPEIAQAADEADADIADATQLHRNTPVQTELVEEVPDLLSSTDVKVRLDTVKANADIDNYQLALQKESEAGLRGKKKGEAKKEIRNLQKESDSIRSVWREHRARVAAAFGAPRNRAEEARNTARFSMIDNMYEPKIKAISRQVEELQTRLTAAERADAAKKELTSFRNMSRTEQLRKVYPNGAPRLRETIEAQKPAAVQAIKEVIPPTKVADVADDSVGAARVAGSRVERDIFATGENAEQFIVRLLDDMEDQPDPINWQLPKWLPFREKIQSAFTTLDASENLVNRALTRIFLENPQGGVVPKDTASILSHHYGDRIRSAVRNRVQEGYDEWSAAAGRNQVTAALDLDNARANFDRLVFEQVVNPRPNPAPGVGQAADGLRDGFELALKIRKENGEAGFENVEVNRNYMPIIMDGNKFDSVLARHPKALVLSVLSRGYQTGRRAIPKKYADKIAELQYERALSQTLSTRQSFERVVSRAEEEEFFEALRKAGASDDDLAELSGDILSREEAKSISNRAKLSLGINVSAEVGGVKVLDLISTDIADLSEGYFKEAAGGAALARHGFRTEQQALQVIDAAEKYGRNIGLNAERLREEAAMLRDVVSLIKGRSIEEDATSAVASGLRAGREFTRIIRLQNLWASSFPEAARSVSYLGLKTVLDAVPAVAFFRRKAARVGAKSSGELTQPEMRELEFLLGYVEEYDWVRPVSLRHEDGTEGTFRSGAAKLVEKGLNLGSRVSNIASGFQAVQGGAGKVTALAIKRRLADMATGGEPLDKKLMNEVGWDDTFIAEFMAFAKDNPKMVSHNGSEFNLLNAEAMTPQMREKVSIGIMRMSARLMQKNFTGDSSLWMNKTLGLAMTQFKSFMLVSMEKQLIHDLRGDKIRAAQTLMWSTLLAYMSYSAQVHLQSFGEKDREAFLRERMGDRSLMFGVFNKLPQTAIVSLAGDVMATLGLLPEDLYAAPGRYGFRPQTAGTVAPVLGTLGDTIELGNSVVDLITGDAEGKEVAERARRLIPLANSVGVGQILKAGIGEL